MTTAPLTLDWAEAATMDAAEAILIRGWRTALTDRGQSPAAVAALIVNAVSYEPRLGLPMDVCTRHGCSVLVDERARDEQNRLFCSDTCRDDHAECVAASIRHALLVDGAHDFHRTSRRDYAA